MLPDRILDCWISTFSPAHFLTVTPARPTLDHRPSPLDTLLVLGVWNLAPPLRLRASALKLASQTTLPAPLRTPYSLRSSALETIAR
jgi:hypothetical protein